jgi:hypothetical protein
MDIKIPNILAGGAGRAMQEAGQAGADSANQRAKSIGGIVTKNIKAENDQQNLIEGQRLENDMHVDKQKMNDFVLSKTDGSDPTALKQLKEMDEEIGQSYISKASNKDVGNYLTRSHLSSQHTSILQAEKKLADKLMATSVNTTKIKTDDSIRSAAQTGEYGTGLQDTINYIELQRNYFGANTDILKAAEVQRYTENYLKTSLSNPVTAPVLVQRLADPVEKKKIFANLDANKIDEMERLLQSAGKDTIRQNAYSKLYEDYKGNAASIIEALTVPAKQKEYGLTMEDSQYLIGAFSRAGEANEKAKAAAWDKNSTRIFLSLKTMTPGKIDNEVASGNISWQLGERFKSDLKTSKEGATDPSTYFKIYKEIHSAAGDPEGLLKARQTIFSTGGLSFSDKKAMLTMTESDMDKSESQAIKLGADHIKNLVMPSQTMLTAAKPAEAANYIDAMKTFDQAIITARKKGEKINPETINKIAKETAQTYQMTIYDQMDASKEKMKADKEKAVQKKAGKQDQKQPQQKVFLGYKKGTKIPVYDIGNGKQQVGD